MFKVIDRYVFKECAWSTLAVIAVLLVILLGNTLVRVLGDIANGELPAETLLIMLLVNLVHYLVVLLPIGLYLGILLGMGRLYRDSEMAAMSACGVGTFKLYRPVIALTIPLVLLTAVLSLILAPWTAGQQDQIRHQARYSKNLSGLVAGHFNISDYGRKSLFFERWEEEGEQMTNVFYYSRDENGTTVQTADKAHLQPETMATYIVFENGKTFNGIPGEKNYRTVEYAQHGVRVKQDEMPLLKLSISSTPTLDLISTGDVKSLAELHWRVAVPIACLLLGLLALPLSHTAPRKGRYNKIGIAILVFIIYFNSLGIGRAWLEKEVVSNTVGMWWAHVAMVIAIFILISKQERRGLFRVRTSSA